MLNTCTASPKSTSIDRSGAWVAPGGRPRPGASTKKSSSTGGSLGGATSMYPPAPIPVSSGSATNDANIAASAASTALPPARRMSAPARAVTGWPAATTPRIATGISEPGDVLRDLDVDARVGPRLLPAHAADARLARRLAQRVLPRPGPALVAAVRAAAAGIAVARRHDRHPHLIVGELLVDHRAEDDVRVGVGGIGDRLGGLVDLPQR